MAISSRQQIPTSRPSSIKSPDSPSRLEFPPAPGCRTSGAASAGPPDKHLARERRGCQATAITNSRRQVEIAREPTAAEMARTRSQSSSSPPSAPGSTDVVQYLSSSASSAGAVPVLDLDVEQLREHLGGSPGARRSTISRSEGVFHLHARQLFFFCDSASALLDPRGLPRHSQHKYLSRAAHDVVEAYAERALVHPAQPSLPAAHEYTQMAREPARHEPMNLYEERG